jgi:6-pyruvoyltetrahydropterin/6-carboxytetrahydropterin synthase
MTFEITARGGFSASHQLRLYDGSLEALHGHNWSVRVRVAAERLDSIGVVMDFHELERRLWQITDGLDNRHLNELVPFVEMNPSAENVALFISGALALPERVRLVDVEVWETPENSARVRAD